MWLASSRGCSYASCFHSRFRKIGTKEQKHTKVVDLHQHAYKPFRQAMIIFIIVTMSTIYSTNNQQKYNLPPLPSIHYHSLAVSWRKWYFRHLLSPYFSGSAAPSALFRFKPRAPMVIWSVPLVRVNVIKTCFRTGTYENTPHITT